MNQRRRLQSFMNLVDIKDVCSEAGIFFWIQNGLLLGLYRGGDCIEHDEHDVDIGILRGDMQKFNDALPNFQELEFRTRATKTPYEGVMTFTLKKGVTKVHVHVNCIDNDRNLIYQPMNKNGGVFVLSKHIYDEFGEIEWQGLKLNCPKDIEGYLVERYGPTWKTPILKSDGWTVYTDKLFNPCFRDKLYE